MYLIQLEPKKVNACLLHVLLSDFLNVILSVFLQLISPLSIKHLCFFSYSRTRHSGLLHFLQGFAFAIRRMLEHFCFSWVTVMLMYSLPEVNSFSGSLQTISSLFS